MTVILVQALIRRRGFVSKSYFPALGVCQVFEDQLKAQNPHQRKITYDISDLFEFIDNIPDLAALVLDPETNQYTGHDKKWMKKSVYNHLKQQVEGA